MKFNGKLDEAEAIGFISVKGITFDVEVTAEESITFLKQILPIARELKSFRLFEVEKDNAGLCKSLNQVRDEKLDTERELHQTKSSAELEKARLQAEVQELKEKLREAQQPVAQPAKKS
jgi:Skp family chaperone for outer membrane proteins